MFVTVSLLRWEMIAFVRRRGRQRWELNSRIFAHLLASCSLPSISQTDTPGTGFALTRPPHIFLLPCTRIRGSCEENIERYDFNNQLRQDFDEKVDFKVCFKFFLLMENFSNDFHETFSKSN